MHEVTLSPEFLAALDKRRGGDGQRYPVLRGAATALLVIDMQNAFVDDASPLAVPTAAGIVPNINQLAAAFRQAAAGVFWIRSTFTASGRSSWPLYFQHVAPAPTGAALRELFAPGAAAHEFWPALERAVDDVVIDKDRFSALSPGASCLEATLAERRIDSLVITGTLTNVCCESTMRDAMMRDYRCVLVSDANAAQSDSEHLAALENAARYFGDVAGTDDVLERIRRGEQPDRDS